MGWLGFGATFSSANVGGGLAGFLGMAPNCLSLFVNVGTFFESANVGGGLADITEFAAKPCLGGSFTVGSILEGGWTEVGGLVGIIGQLCSLFI